MSPRPPGGPQQASLCLCLCACAKLSAHASALSTVALRAIVAASGRHPHQGPTAGTVAGGSAQPDGECGWAKNVEPWRAHAGPQPEQACLLRDRSTRRCRRCARTVVRNASKHVAADGPFCVWLIGGGANAEKDCHVIVGCRGLLSHTSDETKRLATQVMCKRGRCATRTSHTIAPVCAVGLLSADRSGRWTCQILTQCHKTLL